MRLTAAHHLPLRWQRRQSAPPRTMYWVTDCLHTGRTVRVPGDAIAPVVSAWLAELGAHSPLADDLARAACGGDWAAAYAVADQLSVAVTIAVTA